MSQPRMNIYGFPHKGLRLALSKTALLAGTTNYSNEESLDRLKKMNSVLATLLDLHAHSEEDVVLPALEKKVPQSTKDNIEEHVQLENEIQEFNQLLNSITTKSSPAAGAQFYMAMSEFHSKYLAHMAGEENELNPIIWENFTDEEILGWHGQIMASLTPDQTMLWFEYIVPALNPFERSIIMGGFKQNAPPEFFNSVMKMLKEHLTDGEHEQLKLTLD